MMEIDYQLVDRILDRYQRDPLRLLQILIALQAEYGGLPPELCLHVAQCMKVPLTQVQSLVSFYHFLSANQLGQYRLYLSDSVTDRMQGNQHVMAILLQSLRVQEGVPRPDGRVFVSYTSCSGMCDQGPALLLNGRPLTRVSAARARQIARYINAARPLESWPEKWFHVDDCIRLAGPLLSGKNQPGKGLQVAMDMGAEAFLQCLARAGLRGRGGAGFHAARKWQTCRDTQGKAHYIICNADEGEPGTFKDRVLLNRFADTVFEGMTLAAWITGAQQGFLYLRAEYAHLYPALVKTLAQRRARHLLGATILGQTDFCFDIEIHLGAGAYIAGEESALIESLEGRRAIPRIKPPFIATHGYLGQPTVCNNVETFANATLIAERGAQWFLQTGTRLSPGSKLLSISGDVLLPGVYEFPFGTTIRTILQACGAHDVQAVQVGGPSGTLLTPDGFGRCISYEDLPTGGSFMAFNRQRDMLQVVQSFTHFFAHESCGFCTPCRVGTRLLSQAIDKIVAGKASAQEVPDIVQTAMCMRAMSHCGLGQSAANPVLDSLKSLPAAYQARLLCRTFEPGFDLDQALADARTLVGHDGADVHSLPGEEHPHDAG